MSLYAPEDERRIRLQALVREWTKSTLLDPAQGAALDAELRVNLRRTNIFLRAGLALFTVLIVAASVTLIVVGGELDHPMPEAVVSSISAVVCLGLAHYVVVRGRFYRFGVEEALAVTAVALMAIAAYTFTYAHNIEGLGRDAPTVAALLAGAAGGLGVYWRFGYVYAAIGAIACAAVVPFQLDLASSSQHALAAAVLAAAFVAARTQRTRYDDEYPGDDYALLQAAAWAGLYLMLNLHFWFTPLDIVGPFYWFTYAMVWALPLGGLYLAIHAKDRPLLAVGLAMMLVTLLTNKAYLGWTRHEWDPMVLGVFLMGAAVVVRRWLSGGANGQRAGFTAARILSKQTGAVTLVGTASAVFHPDAPSYPVSDDFAGRGGASGGGGASGSF
jgi:hypothetical protein